jgi:hypothetical protein
MELVWFVVGAVAGLTPLAAVELGRRFRIDWSGWLGLAAGEAAILFCVAWSAASVLEGEPRAASMGLITFGGAGLVILTLTARFLIKPRVE